MPTQLPTRNTATSRTYDVARLALSDGIPESVLPRLASGKALPRDHLVQLVAACFVHRIEQRLLFGGGVAEKPIDAAGGVVDVRARHDLHEVFERCEVQVIQRVFDFGVRAAEVRGHLKEVEPVDA